MDGDTRHTCDMAPWVALADIGTAAGTLVLAASTFVAVRASVRSTRIAERALLAGQRPVLAPTGPDDPAESVQFTDGRVFPVNNGQALVQDEAGIIYLAIPLHNEEPAWLCCAVTVWKANWAATSRTTRAAWRGTCAVTRRRRRRRSRRNSAIC